MQEVRFLTEPHLTHKNIVHVKEILEDVEYLYIVRDLSQGELLKEVAQLSSVSERDVASWLLPVTKALHHAHKNGIASSL